MLPEANSRGAAFARPQLELSCNDEVQKAREKVERKTSFLNTFFLAAELTTRGKILGSRADFEEAIRWLDRADASLKGIGVVTEYMASSDKKRVSRDLREVLRAELEDRR